MQKAKRELQKAGILPDITGCELERPPTANDFPKKVVEKPLIGDNLQNKQTNYYACMYTSG